MSVLRIEYPTQHAGWTDAFPKGAVDHAILKDVALHQFRRYAAQRPQCRFLPPEIDVEDDVMHHSERGRWTARSKIVWP